MIPNNANTYLPGTITIPSALEITAITQSFPMVITATMNSAQVNTYIPGQLVRLFIPNSYGMQQANGLTGQITDVTGSNITVLIDSTLFDPFTIPIGNAEQPASLAPSGSRNLAYNNTTNQIAFQNYNNIGN